MMATRSQQRLIRRWRWRRRSGRIYVDKGYRGHDYAGSGSVMIAGRKRGLTATLRGELKRRSAIEVTIGHMNTDGRLDRNFLLGHAGDAINALLVAAGHNLRLILTVLALWLAWCLQALQPETAKSDLPPVFTGLEYQRLSRYSGPTPYRSISVTAPGAPTARISRFAIPGHLRPPTAQGRRKALVTAI